MRNKIFVIIFSMFLFLSCSGRTSIISNIIDDPIDSTMVGKYKTTYVVYYGYGESQSDVIYSNKEVYTCSFQGTNFLLEKDNTEEILSTTAPIRIIKSEIVK